MKSFITLVLCAILMTGCDTSKPLLVGKYHDIKIGNPRIIEKNKRNTEEKQRLLNIRTK